jgi:acylglycerol lipase
MSLSENKEELKYYYRYFPAVENNAIIILIHGLGEHIGRYEPWAEKFGQFNYAVCGIDLPGHGQTKGMRGHIKSMHKVFDILDDFIHKTREKYPQKPIILYGHSMGGNIVGNYILERKPEGIKALILSSPWLKLAIKPPVFRFWLAKWMYKIFPSFPDSTKLDPNFISRIPEEVQRYKQDKLVHGSITPGLFIPIFFNGLSLLKKAHKINLPTLVFHGSGDKLTSHKASKEFAENNDKIDFISYEDGYHELHYDLCHEEVFDNILDWLSVHIVMR